MSDEEPTKFIVATEDARTLPAVELLTGRGFVTGKSGSGKSNTVSVIAEELLGAGYNILIVDTEGEYFGLKEQFEVLHVGATESCDVTIDQERAAKVADITLEHNVPVVLNVADYLDQEEAKAIVANVIERLFILEGEYKKPFLVIVEEMQEYLPQTGGQDDLAKLLLRVAKRGRKRGLGICGISQRPSAVDKDFITQCDWMVWHRLTWENDVEIVRKILGSEVADAVPELDDGEGYLLTDWDDEVDRVQFRRKKTFDAGATPGLEEYERPNLKSIGDELARELRGEGGFDEAELELSGDEPADLEANAEDRDRPNPGVGASDGAGDGSGADAEAESVSEVLDDDLHLLSPEPDPPQDDIDGLDADELRELLEHERRRNEILEGEVSELKQIINEVGESRQSSPQSRTDSSASPDRTAALLEEPRREGAVGSIVELAFLMTYIAMRGVHRIRRSVSMGARRVNGEPTPTGPSPFEPVGNTSGRSRRQLGVGIAIILVLTAAMLLWVIWS